MGSKKIADYIEGDLVYNPKEQTDKIIMSLIREINFLLKTLKERRRELNEKDKIIEGLRNKTNG